MGNCPNCNATYEAGLILCDQCGELLPESGTVALIRDDSQTPSNPSGNPQEPSADETSEDLDSTALTPEVGAQESEALDATDEFDSEPGLDSTGDFSNDLTSDLDATENFDNQAKELSDTSEFGSGSSAEQGDQEGTLDFAENPLLAETKEFTPARPDVPDTDLQPRLPKASGDETETLDHPPASDTRIHHEHTDGEDTVDLDEHVVVDELTIDEALALEVSENTDGQVDSSNTDKEGTYVFEDTTVNLPQAGSDENAEAGDELDTFTRESDATEGDETETLQPEGSKLVQSETGTVYYEDAEEFATAEQAANEADERGDVEDTADFEMSDGEQDPDIPTAVLEDEDLPAESRAAEFTRNESADTRIASSQEAKASIGTTGQLQRMWQGVARSIDNPMQSLQAVGLEASQEIFEKVATRHVTEPHEQRTADTDYHIVNKLGEGAMGVVYLAQQTGVERKVALKTAKANYSKNESSRRRFLYEAQITAELSHSNIVPIYELGSSDEGMLFYSMKVVEGTPWKSTIKGLSRDENLEIFMKVADAIAFAHSKGVIHRDLKPENTMLGNFGEVFVTDWGTALDLSKETAKISRPTKAGERVVYVSQTRHFRQGDSVFFITPENRVLDKLVIHRVDHRNQRIEFKKRLNLDYDDRCLVRKVMTMAGTPCYMSPEMAGHNLANIGPCSDIYLLGAILYQIAAGSPPHKAKSVPDCLKVALANELPQSETSDSLTAIAFRAMATDPVQRYASVKEMQEAIREYNRHSESIALAKRARRLLADAIREKDYDLFSRAIFGYRDALELWPEHKDAEQGMRTARLALGRAAFAKGDYDLVLQTVSEDVADEAELYQKAKVAKQKALAREANFKTLQRVVALVILGALIGLSSLAAFALWKERVARSLAERNEKLAARETLAKNDALEAKQVADQEREIANDERQKAEAERAKAESAREEEKRAKEQAEAAAEREKLAKQQEARAKVEALNAKDKAEALAQENEALAIQERQAKLEAQRRSAQIQLSQFQSTLALAKSQIAALDLATGTENLDRIDSLDLEVFQGQQPKFDTWPYRRTKLLSNSDLPTTQLDGISAVAHGAQRIAVGTHKGSVVVLQPLQQRLVEQRRFQFPSKGTIEAIALSPAGDRLAFSIREEDTNASLYLWHLKGFVNRPQRLSQSGNRGFQALAFSSDGSALVGGLNNGFWMWDVTSPGTTPARVTNLRGSLEKLCSISDHPEIQFVFSARVPSSQQSGLAAGVLLSRNGKFVAQMLDLPSEIENSLSSIAPLPNDDSGTPQVILGTQDERLLVANLTVTQLTTAHELSSASEKHRGPITSLHASANRIISGSSVEPTCHVWRLNAEASSREWLYETYLQGSSKNLAHLAQLSEDEVVCVDTEDTCRYFAISGQKRRQRLERVVAISAGTTPAESESYLQPVRSVLIDQAGQNVVSFDENGALDVWNLTNGSTRKLEQANRWSYIGHTPGSELVDIVLSETSDRILTAARLNNAQTGYLTKTVESAADDWEFCLWDSKSGNLTRRWTRQNPLVPGENYREAVEARVSFVSRGRHVVYASDSVTEIADVRSGEIQFRRDDFGTYFAVPNPVRPSLIMLVKRSGALRLLDLDQESTWQSANYRNFSLADPSDIPMRGVWSADGQRFYMTCTTGMVAAFEWNASRLDLVWSSRSIKDARTSETREMRSALTGIRPHSHLDVDLKVTSDRDRDFVSIATRNQSGSPSTKFVQLEFPRGNAGNAERRPNLIRSKQVVGPHWLRSGQAGQELTAHIHDRLQLDPRQIRGHLQAGGQTFVSTNSARVVQLQSGTTQITSYGRTRFLNASADRNLINCLALFDGGIVWKIDLQAAMSDGPASATERVWHRAAYTLPQAIRIELSPAGNHLLVREPQGYRLLDASSGALIQALPQAAIAAWIPTEPATLMFVDGEDGELTVDAEGLAKLTKLDVLQDVEHPTQFQWQGKHRKLVSLQVLNEQFLAQKEKSYVAIQTQGTSESSLEIIPLPKAQGKAIPESATMLTVPQGTRVHVSPVEAVIATGTPTGTVTVWFASPTWSAKAFPMFDLEGHRGAELTSMKFTHDGKTLVTADSNSRLYAWESDTP